MRKALWLTGAAAVAFAAPALAQTTPPPPTPVPATDAGQRGVLVFEPAFFADQRPNTALEMVNRVPGFSVNDGAGSRGFEGAVGNILINGARPASKNDTGSNVLGRTLASQVARIELIRGGAPGIDMQGYSVVVNVVLTPGSRSQTIVTWNANVFEGGRDTYGGLYQHTVQNGDRSWGIILGDNYSTSDSNGVGQVLRRDANGGLLRDEGYFNDSWGGGYAVRGNYAGPLFGGRIDLTARAAKSDDHTVIRQDSPVILRDLAVDQNSTAGEFGAVYTRPINDRLRLETRLIHQFRDFSSADESSLRLNGLDEPRVRFAREGQNSESILRGLVRYEHSPTLTFETGAEAAYNMLDVVSSHTIGGVSQPLTGAAVKVEETRGEIFGKTTWRARDNLTVEGGIRLEASTIRQSGGSSEEKSFFYPKPRLLVTWTPAADNQVRFRFERELGQLNFNDFAASSNLDDEAVLGGNANLEPEQRWISELIYERRFWGEGIVSIGLRHDEIVDAIDLIPLENNVAGVGNIGDGSLDQLAVRIVVPTARLGLSGGRVTLRNTWNHTEVTDPTTGLSRPISGVRGSQPTIQFDQDIPSWNLQWGALWIATLGQTYYEPGETRGWRGANYFEYYVEYKPTPTLSVRAQLNIWNDFDSRREVYADRQARTIAFVDERLTDPRSFWQIRVRKTF